MARMTFIIFLLQCNCESFAFALNWTTSNFSGFFPMLKNTSLLARFALVATALSGAVGYSGTASAQGQIVNLYSARHYQTDEALYANFTQATGIKVNRVDADDAGILARLKAEGAASPADVILLVDAARLGKGDAEGLFKPIKSSLLEAAIPANLRARQTAEGTTWFGFSTRARVIVYDKVKVKRADVDTYEELADPKNKGLLCTRSGSHPYNLSLFGAVTEHLGETKTCLLYTSDAADEERGVDLGGG